MDPCPCPCPRGDSPRRNTDAHTGSRGGWAVERRLAEPRCPEADADLEILRTYLANRDASCPMCGYNLRALRQATCPECGESLSLAVSNYPSRAAGYTFGLVGLSFSSLLAVFFAILMLRESVLLGVVAGFSAFWIGRSAVRWRRNRKALAGLPRHKTQERVAFCWIGAVIFLVLILGAFLRS